MKNLICLLPTLAVAMNLCSQTIFVDPMNGKDSGSGSYHSPFATLGKAMSLASFFKASNVITIKLFPGLYILSDKLTIKTNGNNNDLSIEAIFMPDDENWEPSKMPVIQSVSYDNSTNQFSHSVGFLAARNNIKIKGLKFVGNSNPLVKYYYPIAREDTTLSGLEISQCYFVGDRYSSPIQGAIWAHGEKTSVDHCIFYECKNALLLFKNIKYFSLTWSIIYGSYEAAVWFGPFNSEFVFRNNIVEGCDFVWVRPENTYPKYKFENSFIVNNKNFMGFYTNQGLIVAKENKHIEDNVKKTGTITLKTVNLDGLYKGYLNLSETSDGKELKAGLFKIQK